MVLVADACLYASLASPAAKACDAVGGVFRPEWREGPVRAREEKRSIDETSALVAT
jgi:hypothetical protein